MTVWQGTILSLTAFVIGGLSFWQNRGRATKSWAPTIKAGGYLVGAALLLLLTPSSDALSGWGTLVLWIIAVLCVLIVFEYKSPETILSAHEFDWQYGEDSNGDPRSGLKLLYKVVKGLDRIDAFMWKPRPPRILKKRKDTPRIRGVRRFMFGVLMVFVVLSWTLRLIFGLFSSDEPPAMGMEVSAGTTRSQSELPAPPTTEAAPVTTTPPATTTTTASASTELLDQSCPRPQGSELLEERTEGVDVNVAKDFYVCRDGGQWLAWKDEPVPTSATILSRTKPLPDPDGKSYVYAVIETNDGMQYYVKAVPH